MFVVYFIISSIIIVFYFLIFSKKECWCNTYSGWPGPLESPFRSNIPALYGNPKYESPCHYNYNLRSNSNYILTFIQIKYF